MLDTLEWRGRFARVLFAIPRGARTATRSPPSAARSGRWPPDSILLACTLFLSGLCPRYAYVAVCSRSGPLTVSRPGLAVLVGYNCCCCYYAVILITVLGTGSGVATEYIYRGAAARLWLTVNGMCRAAARFCSAVLLSMGPKSHGTDAVAQELTRDTDSARRCPRPWPPTLARGGARGHGPRKGK